MIYGQSDDICPFLHLVRPGFYRCLLIGFESIMEMEPMIKNALGVGEGCTNGYKLKELNDFNSSPDR